jgi:hypothetical protein
VLGWLNPRVGRWGGILDAGLSKVYGGFLGLESGWKMAGKRLAVF